MTFASFHHKRFKHLDWVGYLHKRGKVVYARLARETNRGPVKPDDVDMEPGIKLSSLMQSEQWEVEELDPPGVPVVPGCDSSAGVVVDTCCGEAGSRSLTGSPTN